MTERHDPQKWVSDSRGSAPDTPAQPVGSADVPLEPTTVRLDDEARKFLRDEAARQDVTSSEIARQAITFYRGWLAKERDTEGGEGKKKGRSA